MFTQKTYGKAVQSNAYKCFVWKAPKKYDKNGPYALYSSSS